MRHYEIVLLTHPNQADQVPDMVDRYRSIVEAEQGKVHRLETWGIRQLAYPIKQVYKASYILLNIECSDKVLDQLSKLFRFSDAIIRHLVMRRDKAITEQSAILTNQEEEDSEDDYKAKRYTVQSSMTQPETNATTGDTSTDTTPEVAQADDATTIDTAATETKPTEEPTQ